MTRRKTTLAGIIQNVIDGWIEGGMMENIEAAGDPLVKRSDGGGILRAGFQNIQVMGLNNKFAITLELGAMDKVDMDVHGVREINKPWNAQTKLVYQTQLDR